MESFISIIKSFFLIDRSRSVLDLNYISELNTKNFGSRFFDIHFFLNTKSKAYCFHIIAVEIILNQYMQIFLNHFLERFLFIKLTLY